MDNYFTAKQVFEEFYYQLSIFNFININFIFLSIEFTVGTFYCNSLLSIKWLLQGWCGANNCF